jgi:hypothetical protein
MNVFKQIGKGNGLKKYISQPTPPATSYARRIGLASAAISGVYLNHGPYNHRN